jgi:hypothetical protein
MNEELRYKTVINLDLVKMAGLIGKYLIETREGLSKAFDLLKWITGREYNEDIACRAVYQIRRLKDFKPKIFNSLDKPRND